MLAKRRKTNLAASRRLAEDREPLLEVQSKVAKVTAELNKCRELATEASKELKVAYADVVLQSEL